MSEPCWSCYGGAEGICSINGDSASFASTGSPSVVTGRVRVPGGGKYRLLYRLTNGDDPPNSWEARIDSVDKSFPAIVLESLTNVDPFFETERELPFSLPEGTVEIRLSFGYSQVS